MSRIEFTAGRWIRATFVGWVLGVFLILLFSSILDAAGIEHMQFYLGLGMGGGVGLAQYWMFRKVIELNTRWVWASVFGMGIPFFVFDLMLQESTSVKLILSVVSGGFFTGILQFFLLRKNSLNAALWITGSLLGWALAAMTALLIDYTMTIRSSGAANLLLAFLNLLIILSGGCILGTVTGLALRKILTTSKVP